MRRLHAGEGQSRPFLRYLSPNGASAVSSDHIADNFAQRLDVPGREVPHDTHNEPLFNGGEDGLEHRFLDEPGALPVDDHRFAEAQWRSHLTRDGHDHDVASAGVVAVT